MNRETFLAQLKSALGDMPETERDDALDYFEELILDKAADRDIPEEDVIAQLGSIPDIAAAVRAGAATQGETKSRSLPEDEGLTLGDLVFTADAAGVHQLVLSVDNSQVIVRPGKAESVEIRYTQTKHNRYTATLAGDTLHFSQVKMAGILGWGISALLEPVRPVEVYLPADYAGNADMKTSNGKMGWEGISLWGVLLLKTSNGAIHLDGVTAKEISATTSNGGVTAHSIRAHTAIGLTTSNGRVDATAMEGSTITIRSSNGALHVSNLKADDITLRTSNGLIEGTVSGAAGEYSVTSGTSNGQNSLRDHRDTGSKRLTVHTSNASIRLRFAKDEQTQST